MTRLYIPIKKGKKQISDFSEIKTVGDNVLYGCFSNCTDLKVLPSFSNLTTVGKYGLNSIFYNCTNITGTPSFPKLTTIDSYGLQYMFRECINISGTPSFPELMTIGGYAMSYMFVDCTNISGNIDFAKLETITGQYAMRSTFQRCTGINSISFPSLKSIGNKNDFNNMLSGVTGCTVHFPSNLQSVIGSWSDVTAGFGGTNTTVLFDLPATT